MSKKFWSASELETGEYTPTLTNDTNITTSALNNGAWWYLRVGNVVTVGGNVTITATAIGSIVLQATLPFETNNTHAIDVVGSASNNESDSATIKGGTVTEGMVLNGNASNATQEQWTFTFMYRIK